MDLLGLKYHLDLAALGLLAFGGMAALRGWFRRRGAADALRWHAWLVMLLIVLGTGALALMAQFRERARLEQQVAGLAPTYADEMVRLGYEKLTPATPADDSAYLNLIEAQKRWLRNNPGIADIYTFSRLPDGRFALMVDSETDYDGDGRFEEGREARTPIGEIYEEDASALQRVFAGEHVFLPDPVADRWGIWVNTYVPMKNSAGMVVGVLGVDYAAAQWLRAQLWARLTMLALGSVVAIIYLASLAITGLLKADMARRREAEEALRQSETRLRTILDNEPECVVVCDLAGIVREINPAGRRILGLQDAQAVEGQPLEGFVLPGQAALLREHCQRAAAGGRCMQEFEFAVAGGETRVWMEVHSVPLRDVAGRVTAILSVARDVTQRRQAQADREAMQQQLLEVSRRAGMSEIASGVLHNVGNVLNSVNVAATIMSETLRGGEIDELARAVALLREHEQDLPRFLTDSQAGRHLPAYIGALATCLARSRESLSRELDELTRGVDHIRQIVASQQQFSRGSVMLAPESPVEVFEEALFLAGSEIKKCGAEVVREFEPATPSRKMPLDRHRVLQVLINLLTNAAHELSRLAPGMPRRITVRLSLPEGSGRVLWEVEDTGAGVPPENLTQIFQFGFTTRPDGHGCGLHISSNAATEMGGTLRVDGGGEGRGARFTLELPAETPATEAVS